ncbi:MAG: hypothetical protein JXA60_02145 [Candidatus Coatesbacteria bacterium]|nr:hypothetical protein [Candidatus Coatesbacteria bacterium]
MEENSLFDGNTSQNQSFPLNKNAFLDIVNIPYDQLYRFLGMVVEELFENRDIINNIEQELDQHKETILQLQKVVLDTQDKIKQEQRMIEIYKREREELEVKGNELLKKLSANRETLKQTQSSYNRLRILLEEEKSISARVGKINDIDEALHYAKNAIEILHSDTNDEISKVRIDIYHKILNKLLEKKGLPPEQFDIQKQVEKKPKKTMIGTVFDDDEEEEYIEVEVAQDEGTTIDDILVPEPEEVAEEYVIVEEEEKIPEPISEAKDTSKETIEDVKIDIGEIKYFEEMEPSSEEKKETASISDQKTAKPEKKETKPDSKLIITDDEKRTGEEGSVGVESSHLIDNKDWVMEFISKKKDQTEYISELEAKKTELFNKVEKIKNETKEKENDLMLKTKQLLDDRAEKSKSFLFRKRNVTDEDIKRLEATIQSIEEQIEKLTNQKADFDEEIKNIERELDTLR